MVRTYCRKAKNSSPEFKAPKHHATRPAVIKNWQRWAAEKPLHLWPGFQLLKASGHRSRKIYPDRQKALAALAQAMLHHLNLVTHQVEGCIETLADSCGLSTVSEAGNKSITRASRLLSEVLEPAGLIITEKVWDKASGCWIPKYIEVTPLFFEWLGLSLDYVVKEQARRQAYVHKRLATDDEAGLLTICELKKLAKRHHLKEAFRRRRDKIELKKKQRMAKRVEASKEAHGYHELDNQLARDVLNSLSREESLTITPGELSKRINRLRAYYRTLLPD